MLNSINFIINLILYQNSLYNNSSDDGYLIDFQDKFIHILKRIDDTSNDYKLIFRFANFYVNKNEDVSETNLVTLNQLSNQYLIKFINSSLNILVFLGKLNELCSTHKNGLELESKKLLENNKNNNNNNKNLDKSQTINNQNINASNNKIININNNNKSNILAKQSSQLGLGIKPGEKIIDKISNRLNENNRDDIMLKCMNIPNMLNIKRKVMEILLTVSYDQISEIEFDGIVDMLKNSNFLENKMEDIVSKSFLFIIRLLNDKITKKQDRLIRIDNAIECGIKLALVSNTRDYFSEEKFKQTQNINLILSVFLINLSTERKFDKIYSNKEVKDNNSNNKEKKQNAGSNNFHINHNLESLKKIIFAEYESVKKITENNQDLQNQMFPLFYEKVYGMWNVNIIRDLLVNYSVYPFNFIVFRLFRHMADMLMNIPYQTFNVLDEKVKLEKVCENLKEEYKQREVKEVEDEKKNWNFLRKGNKPNTKTQVIFLSEENWKEQKLLFYDKFRDFLNFLCGEPNFITEVKTRLEDFKYDFRLKNPDQNAFREKDSEEQDRLRANLYWANTEKTLSENQRKDSNTTNEEPGFFSHFTSFFNKNEAKNDNTNNVNKNSNNNKSINNNNNNNNSSIRQRKNSMNIANLEPIIKTHLQTIDTGASTKDLKLNFYSFIKEDLREECDIYGTSIEKVFRVKEHETVDNCYLRSLIIAAFLRCVFALTKNTNKNSKSFQSSYSGRINLVEILRNPYIFQKLMMLVDSTKLQDCNINTKILTIIKHVFDKISKNFAEKNHANSDNTKKISNLNGNPHQNKSSHVNETRNAGGSLASKHDFITLVNISSIIIEKTLDNIYFNKRAFSQDTSSEENHTALVRKLVKCCLCIKKEIFKINSTPDEKRDLLKKILSTRLILVLINHALKIMENDIPLQKQLQTQEGNLAPQPYNPNEKGTKASSKSNKHNTHNEIDDRNEYNENNAKNEDKINKNNDFKSIPEDVEYNEYFVDLLILLAEFISCRQEIYIIIIEYVCKKYYIEKRPLRQSFIKDLADLRNYTFSYRLQSDKESLEIYDNIMFISVSRIIFAFYEDKNKSNYDFESKRNRTKINQNLIKNEICILILDQTNLIIKKFDQSTKALDFNHIREAQTLAILSLKDEIKDVRYFPYGNRIFIRQKDNKFVMSILFKKSIECELFLSAAKNVEKNLEFRAVISEMLDKEDPNSKDSNEQENDYGYGMCGNSCFKNNMQKQKDVVDITKKTKRSSKSSKGKKIESENKLDEENDSNKNKTHKTNITKVKLNKNENNLDNENYNHAKEPEKPNFVRTKFGAANSDVKSHRSNRTNTKDKKTNFNDNMSIKSTKSKKPMKRNNENEENKSIQNREDLFNALKEKRTGEKCNKLNDNKSVASYDSNNSSMRSKSSGMVSKEKLKNKLIKKQKEEANKDAENTKDNENNVELTKFTFNDKIFIVAIDYSVFSNVDDLNEESLYKNLYIIKLIGNDKIKIFKEIENNFAEMIIKGVYDKSYLENQFYQGLGDAIYELSSYNLNSVKNILFDNRKIIIEFKTTVNYILNRPIQIYPMDDRGFFYLRNFFVRFIYVRGFHNYSRNFITEAISTRIFKN